MKRIMTAMAIVAIAATGAHAQQATGGADGGSGRAAQGTMQDSSGGTMQRGSGTGNDGAQGPAMQGGGTQGTGGGTQAAGPDQNFMRTAAAGGLAEVASAQVALKQAQDSDVKALAQHIIDDHVQANKELETIAKSKNATLPTEPDPKHKAELEQLRSKTGAEFDKAYVAAQVKDHKEMISLFQQQVSDGRDPELKAYASKTLPALKKHLEHAQKADTGI